MCLALARQFLCISSNRPERYSCMAAAVVVVSAAAVNDVCLLFKQLSASSTRITNASGGALVRLRATAKRAEQFALKALGGVR